MSVKIWLDSDNDVENIHQRTATLNSILQNDPFYPKYNQHMRFNCCLIAPCVARIFSFYVFSCICVEQLKYHDEKI